MTISMMMPLSVEIAVSEAGGVGGVWDKDGGWEPVMNNIQKWINNAAY